MISESSWLICLFDYSAVKKAANPISIRHRNTQMATVLEVACKPIIFRVFHACFEITCCLFSFCHMPPNRDYLVLKPEKFISKPWQDIVTEIQIWKLIWHNAGLCCQTSECSFFALFYSEENVRNIAELTVRKQSGSSERFRCVHSTERSSSV